MRKRVFEIIECSSGNDIASTVYDLFMMVVIGVSLVPLAFKTDHMALTVIDWAATGLFILDYVLRLWTADLKMKRGAASFFLYPVTPMAIIDLLCILPTFTALANGLRLLKLLRLIRTFRVFRAFKMLRYSKSVTRILDVIRDQKTPLLAVCTLAIGYIFISALVVFTVEPDSFNSFFDAVYWATVSLTTVGYGDIYPVSVAGRVITMISSIFGIAVVALPSGIITAGYMERLRKEAEEKEQPDSEPQEQAQ